MARRDGQVSSNRKHSKVFNDPIHGFLELHPACIRIIDTPQFQRLRHIKQLDACYLVYPGACHNRFEHSLGTCHLAGKLMKALKDRQPELDITDRDILCVEIAALCHDLGQGPFSHIFEKKFMPQMKQANPNAGANEIFTHEHMGRLMFEHLLEENGVKTEIQKRIKDCNIEGFDSFTDNDFTFIKEMIDVPKDLENATEWPYEGRTEDKSFMYEIVANKRNGIDVDKWDYIARDSYMLGMKVSFDHNRCFMSARVIKTNGNYESEANAESTRMKRLKEPEGQGNVNRPNQKVSSERRQICYREKDAQDLYDMFYTRMTLHRRAYQHKTHSIIGTMICEAMVAANEHIQFEGKNGNISSIAEATKDMKAYTQLTDDVFQIILQEKNPGLETAKSILNNILNRKLYKIVTQTQVKDNDGIEQSWTDYLKEHYQQPQEEGNFSKSVVQLDYGMKHRNPMEHVRFYRKDEPDKAIKLDKDQVSFVLPETFTETILRIYCNDGVSEQKRNDIIHVFTNWCNENNHPSPKPAIRRDPGYTEPKQVVNVQMGEPNLPDGNTETETPDPNAAAEAIEGVARRDEH